MIDTPIQAMNVIFESTKGVRIVQPFGFKLEKEDSEEDFEDIKAQEGEAAINMDLYWNSEVYNWQHITEEGELITAIEKNPPQKITDFAKEILETWK